MSLHSMNSWVGTVLRALRAALYITWLPLRESRACRALSDNAKVLGTGVGMQEAVLADVALGSFYGLEKLWAFLKFRDASAPWVGDCVFASHLFEISF